MRRPHIGEPRRRHPVVNGIGDLRRGREQQQWQIPSETGHAQILALDKKVNKLDYMDKLLDQRI
ncbi:hypothetical protein Ntsu_17330 [Nocardia sp. IFM 10818]